MRLKNARFVRSYSSGQKYVGIDNIPEICVVGRSNVGKSSLINMLASNGKLARISSTPGRTRLINVFEFNGGMFNLVDLPGYGFALAGKSERREWSSLIENYLTNSTQIKQALLLIDCRHEPTDKDVQMVEYMYYYKIPFTVIATKADKLSRAEMERSRMKIASVLAVGRDNIIVTSSQKNIGKELIEDRIGEILGIYE